MAREQALDDVSEVGVNLHLSKNSAADNDFSARIAFVAFIDGFLFERVQLPLDFLSLRFELLICSP